MTNSNSFFSKSMDPVYQAIAAFAGSLIVTSIAKLLEWLDIINISPRFPWISAAALLLLYAIYNSVFSLLSKKMSAYRNRSMIAFFVLITLLGLAAWGFSSLSINEAGHYRWMFTVVAVCYVVFINLANMLRNIVELAEKEEWHQPRPRRRGKRDGK